MCDVRCAVAVNTREALLSVLRSLCMAKSLFVAVVGVEEFVDVAKAVAGNRVTIPLRTNSSNQLLYCARQAIRKTTTSLPQVLSLTPPNVRVVCVTATSASVFR